ncbi:ImmA/IrrE family metallo-endopeptidase [Rhizohabitans arisaemae]|uniref:ImmA/IrrE family metallo-endopeptidase n=1 Tax=Rhizohabitans arisaemae TaxID=2720610 RepID=UPI0024B0D517|nr:hypothetical protein [Rhizohabitans arisaemae]
MTMVPELGIRWEWEAAPSVRAPEHRATWARIEIGVGADHITLVEDRESGSSRRSIYCPLYPLAEWIAYNWWALRADARPARSLHLRGSDRREFSRFRRHSVRCSGDGFLWPDLLIIPEGDRKRLIWQRDRAPHPGRPIRFLADGEALVDGVSVERELGHLVSAVLVRLAEQGITGTALEQEWAGIQQATPEEVEFCLAAARLGLDPYSEAEPYEKSILRAAGELPGNLLGDFLDAVEPSRISQALEWINAARVEIGRTSGARAGQELRSELRPLRLPLGDRLWEKGWGQARAVRKMLDLADREVFDLSSYMESADRPSADRGLQAIGGAGTAGPLALVEPGRTPGSRRFTLSRALWHYLWSSDPVFLVTTAHTDRQKIERAFAAELLAPAQGISELLGEVLETATQDDLDGVAAHFQVSPMLIKHQLENQLLAA